MPNFLRFLAHLCAILTREHTFWINNARTIRFRRVSEFLPTLPYKYDHCVMGHSVLYYCTLSRFCLCFLVGKSILFKKERQELQKVIINIAITTWLAVKNTQRNFKLTLTLRTDSSGCSKVPFTFYFYLFNFLYYRSFLFWNVQIQPK